MMACPEWKDQLLDAALDAPRSRELEQHLTACATCEAALVELRRGREEMDSALRELVRGGEPSPSFGARLQASLEARRARPWWIGRWPAQAGGLAVVGVVILGGILLVLKNKRRPNLPQLPVISASEFSLAHWRSPTEGLLRSPADNLLQSSPRLVEFYFPLKPAPRPNPQERIRRKP